MDTSRNLGLLWEYKTYLRVEKGLRPLTCEAYDGDLKTFAEFLEGRHGVLLTAIQQDVAAFLEHLRDPRHRLAIRGTQAELHSRLLQMAAARPAHPSRSDGEYRVSQSVEGAAQVARRVRSERNAGR
jgi:hypothetical protein